MPALCILIDNPIFLLVKWNLNRVYAKAVYFKDVGVKEME